MRLRAYWGRTGWGWKKMYGIGDTAATWFVGLTLAVYNADEERTLRHLKRNEEGVRQ